MAAILMFNTRYLLQWRISFEFMIRLQRDYSRSKEDRTSF